MDFESIKVALEGITLLKSAVDLIPKGGLDPETKDKINEAMDKVMASQKTLFALQSENIKLQQDNAGLNNELAEKDNWNDQLSKYKLVTTEGGAVVYSFDGANPSHYACQSCASNKKELHILQAIGGASGRFECPHCNYKFRVLADKPRPARYLK